MHQQGNYITFRNTTHYSHDKFTCDSMGIAHIKTCNTFVIYMVETGEMLRRCMNGLKHSVNTSDNTEPVCAYFLQIGKHLDNLQVSITIDNLNNTDLKKMFELKFILKI